MGVAVFRDAPRPGLQLLRVVLSTLEVAAFFWAVQYLPLADAITFYLAGPIYVTAFSVLFLGETVGWRALEPRSLSASSGVMIALRPSAADVHLAGADRARRQHLLCAADDHDAHGARIPTTSC